MKINENKFNRAFNLFILFGMLICVGISTIFKLVNAPQGARTALMVISGIGALMGVASTVLAASGSIWNFLFGLLDVTIYSYALYDNGVVSQLLLHLLYIIPMEFIGFFQWRKRGAGSKEKVKARRLTGKGWVAVSLFFIVVFLATFAISYFGNARLLAAGETLNISKISMDALSTTANIVALVLMSFAYMEQWYIWTVVNLSSIALWTVTLISDPGAGYTVVMLFKYIFYFLNGLNGIRIWSKLSAQQAE